MKRILAGILCIMILFSTAGCGDDRRAQSTEAQTNNTISETEYTENTEVVTGTDTESSEDTASENEDGSNILIAYFTWAENTIVEDESQIDVDATTSASVLAPGNAAKIAGWIQERTGGDLFSIIVTEPYSSDYDECLERAADEKAADARLELATHVENMEYYDIVFLGFPNWWYTVPMAIHSFLEEYDFSGKTVIPFVTHGTGGIASTIQDLSADLPESTTILEAIGIYRSDVDSSQSAVNEWLDELGFKKSTSSEGVETSDSESCQVKMTVDGQKIIITLYDMPAANSLYEMLPLELTFEDYNGTEKISYLPESLTTDGEPDSFAPDVGDFCLYAPWGNLAVFYEDFRLSDGLILLGHIDSGMDVISSMEGDFDVTLERVEQ